MEKMKAHYPLDAVKERLSRLGADAFTMTALRGALAMDLSIEEAIDVVLGLSSAMLYKSMTTNADHRLWQDVYHAPCPNGKTAYVKLILQEDGALVIQFKER
ncbi:MAG: type II toxin-antitoxin system MqsR family toxin [Azoarcus sp.]|nr:type II toxin-antitoxin system MqsR family toxin [Azoarcus sp.]